MSVTRGRHQALVALMILAAGCTSAATAQAAREIRQLDGEAACLGPARGDGCAKVRPVRHGFDSWAVSADGRFVYAVADHRWIIVLRRDSRTGVLRQLHGRAGCISSSGAGRCARARGMPWEENLRGPTRVVISADGRNVYVLAVEQFGRQLERSSGAILVFRRNEKSGTLRQLRRRKGCVRTRAVDGCRVTAGISDPAVLFATPDGRTVLAAGWEEVAVLGRDAEDGSLRPLRSGTACFSRTPKPPCEVAPFAAPAPGEVHATMAPDGRSVSVTISEFGTEETLEPGRLLTWARDRATGALTLPTTCLGVWADPICSSSAAMYPGLEPPAFLSASRAVLATSYDDHSASHLLLLHRNANAGGFTAIAGTSTCWGPSVPGQTSTGGCGPAPLHSIVTAPVYSQKLSTVFIAGGVKGRAPRRVLSFKVGDAAATLGEPRAVPWSAGAFPSVVAPGRDGRTLFLLTADRAALHVFDLARDGQLTGSPGICLGRSAGCRKARGLRSSRWSINGMGEREQLFESRDRRFLYVLGSSVAAFRIS